ncbi:unnamed protein product, partial [Adineta ricciae]
MIFDIRLSIVLISFLIIYVYGNCKLEGCPGDLCCSEYGFCGDTPEHCKNDLTRSSKNITIRNGDCRICGCEPGLCCSPYGYCGSTKEHCDKSPITTPDSALIDKTRVGDCRICGCPDANMCCSQYGYCGNTGEYCSNEKEVLPPNTSDEENICIPKEDKSYKIFSEHGYLDCGKFSTSVEKSDISLRPKSETKHQEWQFLPIQVDKATLYVIVCMATQKALAIKQPSPDSSFLYQWSLDTSDENQQFEILKGNNNRCKIVQKHTNLTLMIDNRGEWKFGETDKNITIKNQQWIMFTNVNEGHLCVSNGRRKSSIPLTLTDCLQWCEIRKKRFCMWNHLSDEREETDDDSDTSADVVVSSCYATMKCNERTLIQNEKYLVYEFQDSDETESIDNATDSSLSPLDAYIAYTKYLLLEANDFQLNSEPLMCTDLDPNRDAVVVFENSTDGIHLCDLCPNLPPFDKMLGIVINQEDNPPRSTKHNLDFEQCFMTCVDDKQCIGYSYSETEKTCLTFDRIRADSERLQLANQTDQWTTVLIKQPTGLIQNWVYTRNTRISGQGERRKADSVLECLQMCQVTRDCLSITYHFHSNSCQLFDTNEDGSNMFLSYGYLSMINFQLIYGNNSNQWRFIEEDDVTYDHQLSKTKSLCEVSTNTSASSHIDSFYNPNCYLSNMNGCNQVTGCQECLKTEPNSASINDRNLPICPMTTNLQHEKERKERKLNICMTECFMKQNPSCIAIDFDELTLDCQYLTSYSDWNQAGKRRYWMQYPQQKFQFIPQCDLYSSSSTFISFDQCYNLCQRSIQCQKFSYDFNTRECKMGTDRPGYVNKNVKFQNRHCFIRPFLPNNNFTSMRMAFDRTLDFAVADQSSHLKQDAIPCPSTSNYDTCLDTCLHRCLFVSPLNLSCQYISIKYTNEVLTCTYFQNETTVVQDKFGEIYSRYFNSKLTLNDIDDMPLFYPTTDTRECFYPISSSTNEQTYSTLNGYQTSLSKRNETEINSAAVIRQRRLFGLIKKAAKWVGNKIVKPLFNAAKEVVETPIKAVKTLGHLVNGDTKAAKDEFMSIGIVKDVKSLGENVIKVGKAIGKGDVKGALEGIANVGFDALAVVPLPGVGKAASKVGKGIKDSIGKSRNNVKDQLKKSKNGKKDKKNENDKKRNCKIRQVKRDLAGNKHDRDCDDDDDDDGKDRGGPRC